MLRRGSWHHRDHVRGVVSRRGRLRDGPSARPRPRRVAAPYRRCERRPPCPLRRERRGWRAGANDGSRTADRDFNPPRALPGPLTPTSNPPVTSMRPTLLATALLSGATVHSFKPSLVGRNPLQVPLLPPPGVVIAERSEAPPAAGLPAAGQRRHTRRCCCQGRPARRRHCRCLVRCSHRRSRRRRHRRRLGRCRHCGHQL